MTNLEDLSDAHIILLAINLCTTGQLESLQTLANRVPDTLVDELLLRILLTFLPGSVEPAAYLPLLHFLASGRSGNEPTATPDLSSVVSLKAADAQQQVERLNLCPLQAHELDDSEANDPIAIFILRRASQIDQETRDLPTILQLVDPFIERVPFLRQWLISVILPLIRSDYEFYPNTPLALPIKDFEALDDRAAVQTLLRTKNKSLGISHVTRDLRCLVGPWMYGNCESKRRKLSHTGRRASVVATSLPDGLSGWDHVNDWLLNKSKEDLKLAEDAYLNWNGPGDIDLGGYADFSDDYTRSVHSSQFEYARLGLGIVYSANETSQGAISRYLRILERAKQLSGMEINPEVTSRGLPRLRTSFTTLSSISRASLFHNIMLSPSNDLTKPSLESLIFLEGILVSVRILKQLSMPMTCKQVAELALFANEDAQKQELHRLLQGVAKIHKSNVDWNEIDDQICWLRTWGNAQPSNQDEDVRTTFGRINERFIEMELLDALLTASQHHLAVEKYLTHPAANSLERDQVEQVVEAVVFRNYDNASNGNRTRGGIKRAADILKAFRPYISDTSTVHQIEYLLAATHSLSFYHLTLQHGVPFQPVSIRIHSDPIALIGKVLEQNAEAYTHLDDLISIGQNFVNAGLPVSESQNTQDLGLDSALLEAERRITYMAIESALSSSDFDTAYSYIRNRLTPSTSGTSHYSSQDDYSWRAAYLAGRTRPRTTSSEPSLSMQISSLSKRMELLSLALTLAPTPEHLPEILGTWRRCEEELNNLKSAEAEEEAAWDAHGDNTIPGGFRADDREVDMEETKRERARRLAERRPTRKAANGFEEEAPMGLFDVARGAARAIGKSAFPLSAGGASGPGTAGKGLQIRDDRTSLGDEPGRTSSDMERSFTSTGSSEGQRVRKRDMVSNMVTGGLVNGIGWVLGAQPVHRSSDEKE
ncbi:putative protein transport protein [Phaeomoniella chlamydospora]|uniref:Sec39 domain-containing protein n=1 Tax=Phaeomoniella chlamydospora TaxID=158046 RepID=A0A0G2GMY6_PHACM|nr:putative protein transport protein [Phaeomoniella chlamydospora]